MINGYINLDRLPPRVREDLPSATGFVLECCCEGPDGYVRASVEAAEDEGGFALHVGPADASPHMYVMGFASLAEGLDALAALKRMRPGAELWLACSETFARIEGDDLWRGAVNARAEATLDDLDDPWTRFADAIATADAAGEFVKVDAYAPPVIADIAARL
ncbi:hypothetical protein [Methylobacterium sp. CM6257]